MLISVPSTLSISALSDVSHITDIYAQLTDGTKDIRAYNLDSGNLVCQTLRMEDKARIQLFTVNHLVNIYVMGEGKPGNYGNINAILEEFNFYAENYKGQMLNVNISSYEEGVDGAFLIRSVKNQYNI
jgi:hypothetical protein